MATSITFVIFPESSSLELYESKYVYPEHEFLPYMLTVPDMISEPILLKLFRVE